ncbi:hypothetical protein EI94DRAFT_1807163 [Lactarius quietus]|nr:hypothetical protein EI94DRAFT_1807163 [Lactarius quietus]
MHAFFKFIAVLVVTASAVAPALSSPIGPPAIAARDPAPKPFLWEPVTKI